MENGEKGYRMLRRPEEEGGDALAATGEPLAAVEERLLGETGVRVAWGRSRTVSLHMAGDYDTCVAACRRHLFANPGCVTVEKADFVYKGGMEAGVSVTMRGYPRFPKGKREMLERMLSLAFFLLDGMSQDTCLLDDGTDTLWLTRRDA